MTVREIIAAAMRKARIVASGETPQSDELGDALMQFQALVLEHPGLVGAKWRDVFATSDATLTAKDGQRIIVGDYAPTVTFPTTAEGCCYTVQTGMFSRVLVDGGDDIGTWVFSDQWRRIDELTADSENPFGPQTNNGIAAQLAVKIAGDYGADVPATVAAEALRSERFIRSKFYRRPCCCRTFTDYV